MSTKTTRLTLAVLTVALPGPWTPLLVLAYVLARTTEPCTAAIHRGADLTGGPPPTLDPYTRAMQRS